MDEPEAGPAGETVLIVDDSVSNLRLLSQLLRQHGYGVRAATSGEHALAAALAAPPDLILLDICMPGMDGYAVCEQLKALEPTREIPVIFVSGLEETKDKVQAFSVGGVDYVTKPFRAEEVLARVRTHLALRRLQKELQEANRELERQYAELARSSAELRARNAELQEAQGTIKTLRGLIPICAWCGRRIRDEEGNWVQLEAYITARSGAQFSHGICPECNARLAEEEG